MWLESILEVVCVSIGCTVLWLWRGRRYDLPEELRHLRQLALWRWQGGKGCEAVVGLMSLLALGVLIWRYRIGTAPG